MDGITAIHGVPAFTEIGRWVLAAGSIRIIGTGVTDENIDGDRACDLLIFGRNTPRPRMSIFPERPASQPSSTPQKKSRFSRIRRTKETPLTLQFKRANDGSSQTKYFLVSDSSEMSTPAKPKTILCSVGITVAVTVIAFITASSLAFTHYRTTNHLPPQIFQGVFGDYTGPASVSYSLLDGWLKAVLIAVAVGYPIVHALLGRAVFAALHGLCLLSDRVFQPEPSRSIGKWSAETKMLAGALWPATMLLVPFLAVGVLLGGLYRRLWAEPLPQ